MSSPAPHILLAVSGSIAAYKSPLLLRSLTKAGCTVQVLMTPSATEFVSSLVLSNLSRRPVISDMFSSETQRDGSWHIHTAREAAAMIVAPASAKTIASLAYGLCDTALSCVALALPSGTPLVVAPAMDTEMWEHPATQHNLQVLRDRGAIIIEPEEGELASGLIGKGRLADLDHIVNATLQLLGIESSAKDANAQAGSSAGNSPSKQDAAATEAEAMRAALEKPTFSLDDAYQADRIKAALELEELKRIHGLPSLKGKTVLITAGPTRERIDDVRYLSNYSSGKMGYALAQVAAEAGATVHLVSGPVHLAAPANVDRHMVESAAQMLEAVQTFSGVYDIAILCAAVADYRPATASAKLKKTELGSEFDLHLYATDDILAWLGAHKAAKQILVGFALESRSEAEYGAEKLERKNCDMIVVNSSNPSHSAIAADDNEVLLLWKRDSVLHSKQLERMSKLLCAQHIVQHIVEQLLE